MYNEYKLKEEMKLEETEQDLKSLEPKIREYYETNERSKADKKVLDTVGKVLKSVFKVGDTYKTEDGYELNIASQNRTNMDNDVLVTILKERGFDHAIKTVEIPDEKVVEDLIFSGTLTAQDISPAVTEKVVPMLKIKWKGEKKNVKTKKAVSKKVTTKDTF